MSKSQRSFTLIEITIVLGIIGLLAAIVLANYRGGERQFALLRSTHQLAQDLRRAEEMAISSQKTPLGWDTEGEVFPRGGYGIYFKIDPEEPEHYEIILFADCDREGDYDDFWGVSTCGEATPASGPFPEFGNSRDETIPEALSLEEGIKICDLSPSIPVLEKETLHITFIPPDPVVLINGDSAIGGASITLCLKDDETITRTVTINKVGLIDTKKP